jgi:two-component system cell cycle sensor histidine kinase PleC
MFRLKANYPRLTSGNLGAGLTFTVPLIVIFLTSYQLDRLSREGFLAKVRSDTTLAMLNLRRDIEGVLIEQSLVLRELATLIGGSPNITQTEFSSWVRHIRDMDSSAITIVAAPDLVVSLVHPFAENQDFLGFDYQESDELLPSVLNTLGSGEDLMVGPIGLARGGLGIILRAPVYTPGESTSWGIVSIILDYQKFVDNVGLTEVALSYDLLIDFSVPTNESQSPFFGEKGVLENDPVSLNFDFPYGALRLHATPKGSWPKASSALWQERLAMAVIAAVLLCLLAYIIWLAESRKLAKTQLTNGIEALDDGFVMFDKNDNVILWNSKYAEIYDYPEQVLRYGTHYSELLESNIQRGRFKRPKTETERVNKLNAWKEGHLHHVSIDEEQKLSDGRIFRASDRMMADGNYVGLRVDVTDLSVERDKAFSDLEETNLNLTKLVEIGSRKLVLRTEQLAKSQKMESLGRLTAGIAHDFNNLLAAIHWNVELFELSNPSDPEAKELASIKKAVASGAAMTQRLVVSSTNAILTSEPTDIDFLIESKTGVFAQLSGKTIDFAYVPDPYIWPALVDANRFEDAIYNLVLNAKEAMPDGGCLRITGENVTIDAETAEKFGEVNAGDFVLIVVSDTGSGIEPDFLTSVFDPFFTTKRFGESHGLGLSMVYGFAKQSKGHVLIESEPNVSTVVKLYLPRATAHLQIEAKPASRLVTSNSHVGSRILVVEDNLEILSACTRALKMQGFEVVTALTGRDAMARLAEEKPFDILFSDIVLPGDMSGIDVQREAYLIQPNIKCLLTTGYADVEGFGEQAFIKDTQILHKPYTREELLDRIGATLAQV